jgi:hypothetical protein
MANYTLTDTDRRLCYLATELGEALNIEGAATVNSKRAVNNTVVLAPGTSKAVAKTHCVSVDKTITSAP